MNTNERDIRKLIDDWTQALRAKDIRKMMAGYASDVVVFDMRLPHKITGADALEKQWMQGLPRIDGPVHCELTDLHVTAGAAVAFCHRRQPPRGDPPGDCRISTLLTFHPLVVSIIVTSRRTTSVLGVGEVLFVTTSFTTPKIEAVAPESDCTNTDCTFPTLLAWALRMASTASAPKNVLTWLAKSPMA